MGPAETLESRVWDKSLPSPGEPASSIKLKFLSNPNSSLESLSSDGPLNLGSVLVGELPPGCVDHPPHPRPPCRADPFPASGSEQSQDVPCPGRLPLLLSGPAAWQHWGWAAVSRPRPRSGGLGPRQEQPLQGSRPPGTWEQRQSRCKRRVGPHCLSPVGWPVHPPGKGSLVLEGPGLWFLCLLSGGELMFQEAGRIGGPGTLCGMQEP